MVFSLFLSFAEKEYQTESKRNKTFAMIFLGPEDTQETWRSSRRSHEAATRVEGAPNGVGRAPCLVCPSWLPWRNSSAYIFTYIPKRPEVSTKTLFHRRNLSYPWNPIEGPFLASCRRGIRSRRASTSTLLPFRWSVSSLPQTYRSIARWLLLSLWFSIPCSPRCSWRSIRCNTFLRCVCRDPMNCGFMISLSMNIIWIFSEFLYAWFDIFASLFELSIWFGQLDWFFLQWEKCLALGSILRCPFPVTAGAARHVLYCCHRG